MNLRALVIVASVLVASVAGAQSTYTEERIDYGSCQQPRWITGGTDLFGGILGPVMDVGYVMGSMKWYTDYSGDGTALVQMRCVEKPDPSRGNIASSNVTTTTESGDGRMRIPYTQQGGCLSIMAFPTGKIVLGGNSVQGEAPGFWPDVPSTTSGYYDFQLWGKFPMFQDNSVYHRLDLKGFRAYCRNGVWSTSPPPTLVGPAQGNRTLGITLTMAGIGPVDDGIIVVVRNANSTGNMGTSANGRVIFNGLADGNYSMKVTGKQNVGSDSEPVYKQLDWERVVKVSGDTYQTWNMDKDGNPTAIITSDGNNDPNSSGGGSSGGGGGGHDSSTDNVNQGSWWGDLFTSLFVPSQSTTQAFSGSFDALRNWGPFGFITAIQAQAAAVDMNPDQLHYNAHDIYISVPIVGQDGNVHSSSEFGGGSNQSGVLHDLAQNPQIVGLRNAAKWFVYLGVAGALIRYIRPRFVV